MPLPLAVCALSGPRNARVRWAWAASLPVPGNAPLSFPRGSSVAVNYLALLLAVWSITACTPSGPPGFGQGTDYDTGYYLGEHDPTRWLQDYWTETAQACPPIPYEEFGIESSPLYQDICRDALAADLKLDIESFSTGYSGVVQWDSILYHTFYLLGQDRGGVDELTELCDEDDLWAVREPFIEQVQLAAEVLGQDQVRQLLYNMVMSTVRRTVYDRGMDGHAAFSLESRTLRWRGYGDPPVASMILVHEMTHGWLDLGHVECPEGHVINGEDLSGQEVCDTDWDSAYGYMVATGWLDHMQALEADPSGNGAGSRVLDAIEFAAAMIIEE
jgi:hypothetical protein